MTEIVRNLAQFFLKKFPLDVTERHIPMPEYQPYFENKFVAVLGGVCCTVAEITDKILLTNSLLDTASCIFFTGELALVALHALDIKTGRCENFAAEKYQSRAYDECKD